MTIKNEEGILELELDESETDLTTTDLTSKENKTEVQPDTDPLPIVSIEDLFANNCHFGYKTKYRNSAMASYIFKSQNGIDMIDLNKTSTLLTHALVALKKCVSKGGKVLFVGTEAHTSLAVKSSAERCAQYYVSKRWLGGLLTNWGNTFSASIFAMKKLEKQIEEGYIKNFTKREQMSFIRKHARFLKFLEGVKDMGNLPNMVVITSNREKNAIKEAKILSIPVIMIMDTTSNPNHIRYPIPGNDRSIKTIDLFCSLFSDACLSGLRIYLKDAKPIKALKAEPIRETIAPRDRRPKRNYETSGPRGDRR